MSDPVQGQYYFSGAHLASLKVFTLPDAIVEQIKQAGSEDPNWKATLEAVHDKSENVVPDFSIDASGMLLFNNRYVLPDNQALKLRVLHPPYKYVGLMYPGWFVDYPGLPGSRPPLRTHRTHVREGIAWG